MRVKPLQCLIWAMFGKFGEKRHSPAPHRGRRLTNGAAEGDRTLDLSLTKDALYH